MPEALYISGFAATQKATNRVAQKLSEISDSDVHGMQITEALDKPKSFFESFEQAYTHSGGMAALSNAVMERLVSVAAPVPQNPLLLTFRGAQLGRKLNAVSVNPDDGSSLREEILPHIARSAGLILRLSSFNAMRTAKWMSEQGSQVTLGLMQKDGLFTLDRSNVYDDIIHAQQAGVDVKMLAGEHNDFTKDPRRLLGDLAITGNVLFESVKEGLRGPRAALAV